MDVHREAALMQRIMPAVQAAPANGWAVGSALKAISPINTIQYRRRYRRRRYRRYRR
jgi:hypothetical protein